MLPWPAPLVSADPLVSEECVVEEHAGNTNFFLKFHLTFFHFDTRQRKAPNPHLVHNEPPAHITQHLMTSTSQKYGANRGGKPLPKYIGYI